jgi:hypothetical protein
VPAGGAHHVTDSDLGQMIMQLRGRVVDLGAGPARRRGISRGVPRLPAGLVSQCARSLCLTGRRAGRPLSRPHMLLAAKFRQPGPGFVRPLARLIRSLARLGRPTGADLPPRLLFARIRHDRGMRRGPANGHSTHATVAGKGNIVDYGAQVRNRRRLDAGGGA